MISKILYLTLFFVILLIALAYTGQNDQLVSLDLVFISLPQMPLFILSFGTVAVGILIGLLPCLILVPYLKAKVNAMQNRIEMLEAVDTE